MGDMFYKIGYCIIIALPVIIGVFCLYKIRRNRQEIKNLEAEKQQKK